MVTVARHPSASGGDRARRVWNVPFPPRPVPIARPGLLDAVTAHLAPGTREPLVLTGRGGVGKTQVAVELVYSHRAELDVVWWVRAGDANVLRTDLAALGREVGLDGASDPDLETAAVAVRTWLERSEGWLVVADDAVDARVVSTVLPRNGRLLVTTRGGNWAGTARALPVDLPSEDEAADFLVCRTGDADRAAAAALAEDLGRLPFALEQAGAYVAGTSGATLAGYHREFRSRQAALSAVGHPSVAPDPVAVTSALAVDRVEETAPAGATVLRACAFLGADGVPHWLLGAGPDELPEPLPGAPEAIADGVAALDRFALASDSPHHGITVHRLVQGAVRDHLAGGSRSWAAGVLRLVAEAFPADSDDRDTWDRCARLLPHALAITAGGEVAEVEPQATSRLLDSVALYHHGRGQWREARRLLERAVAVVEVAYGPDDPEAGVHLAHLAGVLSDRGDHDGARACLERALALAESAYGADHPTVGDLLENLGRVLGELGQRGAAKQCYERALAIDEAVYGPDHPTVGRAVANCALVLQDQGALIEARVGFERALTIAEAANGPDHPEVGAHLDNLGTVLADLGSLPESRACLVRALLIARTANGPDHPAVAHALNNLGGVLALQGDVGAARQCFERALPIAEAAFGPDHPRVRGIRANLVRLSGPTEQATATGDGDTWPSST